MTATTGGVRLTALAVLVAIGGCGGCGEERTAAPMPPADPPVPEAQPLVTVEVLAGTGLDRRGLAGVELLVVPAEELEAHLGRRRAAAERLEGLRAEEARLGADAARARAENDARSQALMSRNADWIRERAALSLGRRPAGDVAAARRAAGERRVAATFQATRAAHAALDAERRLERLARERAALQATLLEGLPAPIAAGTSGPGGLLVLPLPPGRYAIVGIAPAQGASPTRTWLGFVRVADEAPPRVVLDDAAGADPALATAFEGGTP